jgi:hypothetical protein
MSYINNIITGSMNPGSVSRGIIGYNFSGSLKLKWDNLYSRRFIPSQEIQAGSFRNVRLTNPNEIFLDSLLPDPGEITRINGGICYESTVQRLAGGGIPEPTVLKGTYIMLTSAPPAPPVSPPTNDPSDSEWLFAFPFEPKYSHLKRRLSPTKGFASRKLLIDDTGDGGGIAVTVARVDAFNPYSVAYRYQATHVPNAGTPITFNAYFHLADRNVTTDVDPLSPTNEITPLATDFLKHYFGIHNSRSRSTELVDLGISGGGDGPPWSFISGSGKTVLFHQDDVYRDAGKRSCHVFGYGAAPRGWKYGILNAVTYRSNAVFRRDRFGQFRDMLEQRLDSKFFGVAGDAVAGAPRESKSTLDSPIKCRFVDSEGRSIEPNRTNSSNLSPEATSSLPYFDGMVKNRENPLNISIIDSDYFSA